MIRHHYIGSGCFSRGLLLSFSFHHSSRSGPTNAINFTWSVQSNSYLLRLTSMSVFITNQRPSSGKKGPLQRHPNALFRATRWQHSWPNRPRHRGKVKQEAVPPCTIEDMAGVLGPAIHRCLCGCLHRRKSQPIVVETGTG